MAIELGALNIPLRATGREGVLQAFAEIEAAGKKTAAAHESGSLKATRAIMRQEAQVRANAQALKAVERQARQTFDRIALDVSRATADYRLGLITLKDYQQALAFAKQEVIGLRSETGALNTVQLAKFDRVLNQISASARSARREAKGLASDFSGVSTVLTQRAATAQSGIRRMTSGISQMAVMALGARSAVGSLAVGGLLAFGASAGLTLAVVAGTAAIAFGYDKITKASREAKEELKKLREELAKPTERELASKSTDLIREEVAKARQTLAFAEKGQIDPSAARAGVVIREVDPAKVERAKRALAEAERQLDKLLTIEKGLDKTATDQMIEAMVKAVELRTASASIVRNTLALLPQLDAASRNEKNTLDERNKAAEQANSIRAAFKKLADEEAEKRAALIDGMKDESALLVEVASQRALTAAEVARLRAVYVTLTSTLEGLNLTDRERLELLKAQTAALKELATQTSQTFTTKGSTFGMGGVGRPKTPGLDSMKFGPDEDKTSEFFAGGALGGFTTGMQGAADRAADSVGDALASAGDKIEAHIDEMRDRMATGLAEGLADGIASGFEHGIATGSIGEGAKALTASLLSALGSAAISFGVGALAIAIKMELIKKSLMSLNPALAIPAAIGLIALGGALKGVASRMFNGGSSGSVSGGGTGETTTTRVIVGQDGQPRREGVPVPGTAASTAASMPPSPNFVFAPTIVGKDDQQAQRQFVEMLNLAAARGYKVRV